MIINPGHNIKLVFIPAVHFEKNCWNILPPVYCVLLDPSPYCHVCKYLQNKNTVSLSNATHMSLMLFHISTSDQNKTQTPQKILKDRNTFSGLQPTVV